jgi:hypothetical protein
VLLLLKVETHELEDRLQDCLQVSPPRDELCYIDANNLLHAESKLILCHSLLDALPLSRKWLGGARVIGRGTSLQSLEQALLPGLGVSRTFSD